MLEIFIPDKTYRYDLWAINTNNEYNPMASLHWSLLIDALSSTILVTWLLYVDCVMIDCRIQNSCHSLSDAKTSQGREVQFSETIWKRFLQFLFIPEKNVLKVSNVALCSGMRKLSTKFLLLLVLGFHFLRRIAIKWKERWTCRGEICGKSFMLK